MPATTTRRVFLLSLNCAPWVFAKSWDTPVFPAWSREFVDKLLTDSPWAQPSTVRVELDSIHRMIEPTSSFNQIELPPGIGLPRSSGSRVPGVGWPRGGSTTGNRIPPISRPTGGGGPGSKATAEIFLTTRWASALPIRRAQALQEFGRERLGSEEAAKRLNAQPSDYVVEIAGFPATIVRQDAERFARELKNSARLAVPGRRPVAALTSEMPEPGMHLMATLTFPRFEGLHQKEEYIEISAAVRGIKISERFKLKDMIYGGNLEL